MSEPIDDWGMEKWNEIGFEAYLQECNACRNFSSGYVRKDWAPTWAGKLCNNCGSDDVYIVREDG